MWNSSGQAASLLIAVMAIGVVIVGTSTERQRRFSGYDPYPIVGRFMVRIIFRSQLGGRECSGAIMEPRHVITALECLDNFQPEDRTTVYSGVSYKAYSKFNVTKVKKVFRHPKYRPGSPKYNLAILELQKNLSSDHHHAGVLLPSSEPNFSEVGLQLGWSTCGRDRVIELQKVSVNFLTDPDRLKYNAYNGYPEVLCIDAGSEEPCPGDIGSPILSAQGYLVGIVSGGVARKGDAYHAQNVYHSIDWINSIINESSD